MFFETITYAVTSELVFLFRWFCNCSIWPPFQWLGSCQAWAALDQNPKLYMQVYGQSRCEQKTWEQDFGQRLVRYCWYFYCSISLLVSFPYPYCKKFTSITGPKQNPSQGCPRSIPAVRGMYDRYPLGWPGGSPAPNLVAWIDETIRESIPDGFWDVPFFFGYQASQQGFSREFPWK